jgi:surface protein
MNNLAFQIYGTKKATPFQSVWKTDNIALGADTANKTASTLPSDWALAPGGTNLLTGGYTHNGSGSSVLLFPISSAAFQNYQIICTLSAGSTGSVVISLGNVSSASLSDSSTTIILTPTAGSGTLSITPVNFVGTVSLSVKASSSAANQIQLPITSIPVGKSIWIDWGDNSYTNANNSNYTANIIHTYAIPGQYTVRILGDNFSFGFGSTNSVNDRLKIKSISSWGKLKMGSSSFNGCSNVTMSGITDVPDLIGVTNLSNAFNTCSNLTTVGRMNEWNMSSVTNLLGMFSNSGNFNQCIGGWNVSNVTTFEGMFYNCLEFNNGDNSTPINNWILNTTSSVSLNYPFINCRKFNRYIGDWNTSKVNMMADMFQGATVFNNGFAAGVGTGNQLNWDTSSCTNMSRMFVGAPAFNSNVSSFNVSKVTTFNQMFTYCNAFNNGFASGVANQLPWNISSATNMTSMFQNCTAFNSNLGTGTTQWDVSKVTTFASMFSGATAFNNGSDTAPINNWAIGGNITGTISMSGMFVNASNFNMPISNWNMTKVTNTSSMFANTNVFNQSLFNWERAGSTMGNVTDMSSMFTSASVFNQNIGAWNVSNVTTFASMFNGATAFNNNGSSDINNWAINTVSNVTMGNMFVNASNFNMPISNWNMTKVNNTAGMFNGTTLFNQPLANWERAGSTTGNITAMQSMFQGASAFNQDISSWNVNKVTNFGYMFRSALAFTNGDNNQENPITFRVGINGWNINTTATSVNMAGMFFGTRDFNRNINSWNVSKVTSMSEMFNSTTTFNQSLNSWNTVSVVEMVGMFELATAFNEPIDNWNMSNVTATRYMFNGATIFNQPLSNWERNTVGNVSTMAKVTSMNNMFSNAIAFNKNIGNWNVSNVANFSSFMIGKTSANFLSTNLDAIYNGWIVNGVKPNISISFGTAKYSQAGKTGKDALLASPNNWTITDGGNENVLVLDAGNPLSYPGTGTTWTDLSGNNNNGTLINGPTFDSANGGSIVFNGVSQYVNCGNASNLKFTNNFTINVWVKFNSLLGPQAIISNNENGGYGILANSASSRLETFYWINGSYRKAGEDMVNYNTSSWFNISVTFNGSNVLFYRNGNLIQSVSAIGTVSTNNLPLLIGANPNISGNYEDFFNGKISQVQTYNKVLTPTELLANFNATKGRYGL